MLESVSETHTRNACEIITDLFRHTQDYAQGGFRRNEPASAAGSTA